MATFQERFNILRADFQGNDSELAKVLGCSKQTISAWASGKRSPKFLTVKGIADYFNVSPLWLVGGEEGAHHGTDEQIG